MSKSTFYLRCSYEIGIARSGSCRLLASVNNIQHSSTNTGAQFYIHTNTNTTVHPCIHLPGISFWLWLNLISQHSSRSRCWLTVVETEQYKHSRNSNANTTTITNRVRARLSTKPFIFTTYNTSWNVSMLWFCFALHNERLLRWNIAWILMFRLVDVWIGFFFFIHSLYESYVVNWRVGFYDSSLLCICIVEKEMCVCERARARLVCCCA